MNANIIVMKKGRIPFFSDRKTTRENFQLSFTQAYIMTLLLIWFLGIYYVWSLNTTATQAYSVRKHEIERRDLTFAKNQLDLKIAEAQSLNILNDSKSLDKMEDVSAPQYLVLQSYNLAFIKKD